VPRPGEVTLAHRGVLFLDEIAEFSRPALDSLRQPLEEGRVEVVRGQRSVEFPAAFALVAACNGCPCGRPQPDCQCSAISVARYTRRLSGPLLDRLDLVCRVDAVPAARLVAAADPAPEGSAAVRRRVVEARERQRARLAALGPEPGPAAHCNAEMGARLTRLAVRVDGSLAEALVAAAEDGLLSGRGHGRVLRVARTIADLDGRERVGLDDVHEALGFRSAAHELVAA
jgi:magnesium chelatase family protein